MATNEKLEKAIEAIKKLPNVTIKIIGEWLWLTGDTKPVKEQLKEIGCRWSNKKKQWYFNPSPNKFHYKKDIPMAEIIAKYGMQEA